ncbi:kinesin-like protein KIF16B isoform X2 [Dinothrombium tinctorium]|uniref:Kinesin-like protein KIF16B isoform X2 n=1 Tax=Dinothrombium tinctorium TaxID=1965070 RepID=A0A3S3RUX3_9ACAR|nr:kinesin-like protein KIF16B isoform X2 [Dinothrombium tinctorium]RWS05061.1 kinesin-like protein KIF16B isoform X2 [Dinothrombium tinctorium]
MFSHTVRIYRELDLGSSCVVKMQANKTILINANPKPDILDSSNYSQQTSNRKEFIYDYSYWSFDPSDADFVPQHQVYEDLGKEVVEDAFVGYNACIFAYGQTGSGKTYTMMGTPDNEGLIPRICQQLFNRMDEGRKSGSSYRTEVSYLEIYNERVKDLLGKNCDEKSLKVREHPKLGPYVQSLSKHLVTDYSDVQELMTRGNAHRTTAATGMNDTSSRSHAIFTIAFSQASFSKDTPRETLSKVNLVDLAGSERANATGATGVRLKEGGHINKSLVTLGSVIKALAECSQNNNLGSSAKKPSFIPYRDSVLTWLLKDSLGGNSKTVMIATISPADCNYSETLSTLRYANRAKNIINKPTINEDSNTKLIRDLRAEIERLKLLIAEQPAVIEKVHENEAKVKLLTEEWTEKWKETQRILKEQRTLGLRKSGLGVVLDSDMPHLVGIDDDLLSTGITLYHLKEGQTKIGTEFSAVKQDIVLHGYDIEDEHCLIELENGIATLVPLNNAICFVNTELISKPTKLSQGCVILLGRNNMFRFNDPIEVNRLRSERMSGSCLNLSRVFHSSEMAKSVDNLFSPNSSVDYSDMDLEEKRREVRELEEEHQRAEQRRREEAEKIDRELQAKKEELLMIKNESEHLLSAIEESRRKVEESERQLLMLQEERAKIIALDSETKESDLLAVKEKTDAMKLTIVQHLNELNAKQSTPESIADILQSVYNRLEKDIEYIKKENSGQMLSCKKSEEFIANGANKFEKVNHEESDTSVGISDEIILSDHLNKARASLPDSNLFVETGCQTLAKSDDYTSLNLIDVNCNTTEVCLKQEALQSKEDSSTLSDILYNKKLEELKTFELKLREMEEKLREQQSLFEIQRNKELSQIEREKRNLLEMEKEAKLEEIIEREVNRRLHEHQLKFEESWREQLESRVSGYLRLTASPSPPSTPNSDHMGSRESVAAQTSFSDYEQMSTSISIAIPSYVFRNDRDDPHFEYQITITANGEQWCVFRRFRIFREFHLQMKRRYGSIIVLPYFPPRTCFGKTSITLAESRKVHLEKYLQQLISRCQQVKGCPLNWHFCEMQPMRSDSLIQFSSFFKRENTETRSEFH